MNHFDRLGMPRRFFIDMGDLERAYLNQSREIHPDRHQLASTAEQSASVELSATLNEAYQTLRDPFKRAEYLLTSQGGPTATDMKEIPLEFLDEMLDLRMEIGSLKAESPAAEAMEQQLIARRDLLFQDIGHQLERTDSNDRLKIARQQLNSVKYISNLLRDLRAL